MKLILLGRDGVINQPANSCIKSPQEWIPIKGSLEAIAQLSRAGYRIVVITNQPGIGDGELDIRTLNSIHEKMHQQLNVLGGTIESILFCPHRVEDNCDCRIPRAGLLLDLQIRLNISLLNIPFVGDSIADVQAAREVNAAPILVRSGYGEDTLSHASGLDGIPVYNNLSEYTAQLLTGAQTGS